MGRCLLRRWKSSSNSQLALQALNVTHEAAGIPINTSAYNHTEASAPGTAGVWKRHEHAKRGHLKLILLLVFEGHTVLRGAEVISVLKIVP